MTRKDYEGLGCSFEPSKNKRLPGGRKPLQVSRFFILIGAIVALSLVMAGGAVGISRTSNDSGSLSVFLTAMGIVMAALLNLLRSESNAEQIVLTRHDLAEGVNSASLNAANAAEQAVLTAEKVTVVAEQAAAKVVEVATKAETVLSSNDHAMKDMTLERFIELAGPRLCESMRPMMIETIEAIVKRTCAEFMKDRDRPRVQT